MFVRNARASAGAGWGPPLPIHDACDQIVFEFHFLATRNCGGSTIGPKRMRVSRDTVRPEVLETAPHRALAASLTPRDTSGWRPRRPRQSSFAAAPGRRRVPPRQQLRDHVLGQFAQHPHRIFTLDLEARVHELLASFARGG